MHKIVMLSGGTESTALLFKELKILKETDRLIVHHVQLVNVEVRHEAEAWAVQHIVKKARGYGNFIFTTSRFDWPDIIGNGYCGMDIHTLGFMAGHIAKQVAVAFGEESIKVLFGASREEEDPAVFFNDARYIMMKDAFLSHWPNENVYEKQPKLLFPYIHMSIYDQIRWIPKEALKYVISCRRPVKIGGKFLRCGNCYTCEKIETYHLLDANKQEDNNG